jgi:Adenylate kinase and related kinases
MILFFGAPGSGKSVQGQLLVERYGWQWLSTGDMFRRSKDPEVLKRLAAGVLIDDVLTNKTLSEALKKVDKNKRVILDGYPRNVDQAEWLLQHVPDFGRKVECVILFEVPREELIHRQIGRGRSEDAPEIIGHRLDIYQEKTKPAVDLYRERGIPVMNIDGTGTIEEVHERVNQAIMTCLQGQ